jgi:putative membrane protein
MVLGLRDRRAEHRRVVRWAYPIWLYVSLTGVLVYFMLYWWFLPLKG